MKYKIKYNYNTGDSFHNEDNLESYLELEWNNLSIAKANLQRIKEHYTQYQGIEYSFKQKSNQELLQENQHRDWFVKQDRLVTFKKDNPDNYWAIDKSQEKKCLDAGNGVKTIIDEFSAKHQIILYTDDKKSWQFHAPWCGYFNSLNDVEIVCSENDLKIKF
jgi:hypothetical protein